MYLRNIVLETVLKFRLTSLLIYSNDIIYRETCSTNVISNYFAFATTREELITRNTTGEVRFIFPPIPFLALAFTIRTIDQVSPFNQLTVNVAKLVIKIVSHWLVDLHWVIVVSVNNELVFLKTGIAKVVVPCVIITNLITIYGITCKVVRGIELISSPSVSCRVCMSKELRIECNTLENLRIVQIDQILKIKIRLNTWISWKSLIKIGILIAPIWSNLSIPGSCISIGT